MMVRAMIYNGETNSKFRSREKYHLTGWRGYCTVGSVREITVSRTKRNFQHHCSGIKAGRDGYWGNRGQYGYWSRRPLSGYNPSHANKIMCNRIERRSYNPKEIEFNITAEGIE